MTCRSHSAFRFLKDKHACGLLLSGCVAHDRETLKEAWIRSCFQKRLEHIHVQAFPKAAGTREEVDTPPVSHKVRDHLGFVHIIKAFSANGSKKFLPDRELQQIGHGKCSFLRRILCTLRLIARVRYLFLIVMTPLS